MVSNSPTPWSHIFASPFGDRFHDIHCTVWGLENRGPTAILVHGYLQNGREFDPLAIALAREGWRVFCPDLPGHGRSQWHSRSRDYRAGADSRAMATVIAVAVADAPRPSLIHLLGSSMGGGLVLGLATVPGIPLKTITLVDVNPRWPGPGLERVIELIPSATLFDCHADARAALMHYAQDRGPLTETDIDAIMDYCFVREGEAYRLRFDPALRQSIEDMRGRAGRRDRWPLWDGLRVPTLIVRGEHSVMVSSQTAQEMVSRNPLAEVITIPGCGHPPWLRRAEEIEPVVSWLVRHAA